ncbi:metallophosphoesterase family protein [Clostridium baratii]
MSNNYKVFGGEIQIYGDLHLSCIYEGQHKNYIEECYYNMDNIVSKVKDRKASAVILLGDVIGVNERNTRDRQFLMRLYLFFQTLNDLTNRNVYAVKGNHDKGDFSDFDFFLGIGLLKNPNYVDYYGCSEKEYNEGDKDGLEVRFHFVNYGEENRELTMNIDEGYSNVVLGHADYIIDGVTNWYQHKGGVNLARLSNFAGVDLVVSGHIHNPSEEILTTTIKGEYPIGLFYTGSPARTAERFNDCWYLKFEFDGESTKYDADLFGLRPADEVFYPKEDIINDASEEDLDLARESESLTNIVKEIMEGRMTNGDLFAQVRAVPGASDEVKDIACSYLQKAIDNK